MKMGGGGVREGLRYYPYLFMLMKIWPRYWDNQLESIDMRVYG